MQKKRIGKDRKEENYTEYVRNIDKRNDFIKKYGQKKFDEICKVDKHWAELTDIPLPNRFKWLWDKFITLWQISDIDLNGNIIFTPRTVLDYCELFKVTFSHTEILLMFRMKNWASGTIYELKHKEG